MRIKKQQTFWVPALLFILTALLNNCGYSIHRHADIPFTEIKIGLIENKTFVPKLQDKLHKALTEEFLKQGISVNPYAKFKLTGIIHKYDMIGLSEKGGITLEYKVVINADFKLIDEKGDTREIKDISSPFIVSFAGSEDFGRLIANKDLAEEKALSDIAMQIIGALIYK